MKECALNSRRVLYFSDWQSSEWSEWVDIHRIPNYEGCGIYHIRLVTAEGIPVKIPRFIDTDRDGILQVCYSDNIKRGIYRFLRATEGKRYGHAEGARLQVLKKYSNFKEKYKGCKMEYSFKEKPNRKEARVEQERLLKCYVKKYGEVPPNNNNFPKKHIDWESLRVYDTTKPITFSNFIYDISSDLNPVRLTKIMKNR